MSSAVWYFSRATGLVSLALFTGVVVLGALGAGRFATRGWPRFTVAAVHRNLALTSLAFLAAHIASAILDGYVPLGWLDVVVPFGAGYQPLWVGLGAVAIDLVLAIVVTSLVRTRLPARAWRAVHWLAYLCWPVALVHGFGMAEDDSAYGWIAALDALCVLAVLGSAGYRAARVRKFAALGGTR
ncbi:ferric reductase-like transmembrane domain-containing protein [Amycolatopsis sp. DG1A-15b]|uniref:ferric reductase-like transmembrane domain-containing protein n=1 Tax=Amycolatopsis sp. DG1A-15b TaxID=3052846 RepID=UPI00255BD862|nr:ferric reductase-like transmembrane domain-containing protein [Amycolatopsis sp. DG1A-15b]WIX92726.1 ferric reductase-like transmembrane domain-containing protein [Amycolatopsis sp. DG1A-15b]